MKKYVEKQNNNSGEIFVIDPLTGEIMDFSQRTVYVQTEEERAKAKEFFKTMSKKKDINSLYKNYGNFLWSIYNVSQSLYPNLKGSYITRLMFLATYINYNGYLSDSKNIPLTKTQMCKLLNISEREFSNFYKCLLEQKIISEDKDKYCINKDMFQRGELSPIDLAVFIKDEKYVTRIYISAIRSLYNKSTIKSHKTLSYLFQVIPYVNRDYNIICSNPLETDLDKINKLTLGEFADIIEYNRSNISRLCNILFSPTFTIGNKELTAMRYVVDKSLDKSTYSMFINPRVYYAGTKWKEVEILGQF